MTDPHDLDRFVAAQATTYDAALREILGEPDDMKLRSSATLFAAIDGPGVFTELLERFFDGVADEATLSRLRATDEGASMHDREGTGLGA